MQGRADSYKKGKPQQGLANFGRSVIIGFQKTQIYQRFAGSRQEVFILHLDYALQVDSRFRPFIFPSIP